MRIRCFMWDGGWGVALQSWDGLPWRILSDENGRWVVVPSRHDAEQLALDVQRLSNACVQRGDAAYSEADVRAGSYGRQLADSYDFSAQVLNAYHPAPMARRASRARRGAHQGG